MTIAFSVGGAVTAIPGIYDTFRVANSLPNPVPAGRSVLILGESEEGVPGSDLDLKINFFTSFNDVQDFYKSGAIVDAARMLFSNQPSPQFRGAIQRLFVWKTNATTRAEKAISAPAGFGSIVAFRYGEPGNLIKSQILDAQSEVKPTKTFKYLPLSTTRSFRVMVNGQLNSALSMGANTTATDLVTLLNPITGLSATGGTLKIDIIGGTINVTPTATLDTLTLTKTGGAGTWNSTVISAGDVAYIAPTTDFAGASDENAGAYIVQSVSSTELVLKQLSNDGGNFTAFDTTAVVAAAAASILINSDVTVAVDATTAAGQAASLELLENAANKSALNAFVDYSALSNLLADSTSSIAAISATVPSAGKLTIALSIGSWVTTPKAGDIIKISMGSLIAGATNKNVGFMVVESSGSGSITASHLQTGMTTEAVASVDLASANDTVKWSTGFVTSTLAARRIDGAAERKVKVVASRESDGASFPPDAIGGKSILELGYYAAAATACTVTINSRREMTITPTGSGLTAVTVLLNKYKSLSQLVSFLNTQTNLKAKLAHPSYASVSTKDLDAVQATNILDGSSLPAYNGKIKSDYADWVKFFSENTGLLAFKEGSLAYKAGLPDAEAVSGFLSGAVIGATTNADIQAGFDAGLKINVRQVIPLFSRDASKDVLDAETDPASSWSIDAIHAAGKAHAATASSSLFRKERFTLLSFDGSFEDSKLKAGEVAFERCPMSFMRHAATDGAGEIKTFLPWMAQCAVAAGRSQALLGTSMLNKPLLLSSAEHVGDLSLFTDTLEQDFDPEDRGELEEAIRAGLMCFQAVEGFGVKMVSPDLSSRSRDNDPQAWVYERINVLFTCDEVRQTVRSVIDSFIGERQSDVPTAVVRQAIEDTLKTFKPGSGNGSILSGKVLSLDRVGTTFVGKYQITPVEAIEAIILDAEATRAEVG